MRIESMGEKMKKKAEESALPKMDMEERRRIMYGLEPRKKPQKNLKITR